MRLPPPLIRITSGTFHRHHPASLHPHNPPVFTSLSFSLPAPSQQQQSPPENWAIIGPSLSGKTTLLQILRGQHLCFPPTARSFPYLATDAVPHRLKTPSAAIAYVGFDASSGLGPASSAYLSARYESRREMDDFSVRDYLLGNTQFNALKLDEDEEGGGGVEGGLLERVVRDLRLDGLLEMPVAFLSNGQGRRARIARALLTRPEVVLLDEPFMGLDPPTVRGLSGILGGMVREGGPRVVVSGRPQDPLPEWISHLVYLRTDCQVGVMGERETVLEGLRRYVRGVWKGGLSEDETMPVHALGEMGRVLTQEGVTGRGMGEEVADAVKGVEEVAEEKIGEPLVEMEGCRVRYGDKVVLGGWTEEVDGQKKDGLHWTVRQGERWGVFGPNGSGKTTIVSLLCSDHPQTYSLPIKLFGRSRLPEPGSGQHPLTYWDIQSRIGHSSPEIHQHMPRRLTTRQVLESAWADTFLSKPTLDDTAKDQVEATLRWFAHELNPSAPTPSAVLGQQDDNLAWADEYMFGELPFSAQRILLFLRAIIKHQDIVVLDEAFSGMDEAVRDKCMLFLAHGEKKMYTSGFTKSGSGKHSPMEASVVDNPAALTGNVKVTGLKDHQALICISHVKEEVPDCVREWLCLPEANTGLPARFGRLNGPLRNDGRRWDEIWGV